MEALGLVGAGGGLFLRAATLELPECKARLIGEATHDRDRGRVGLVDDRLPGDDEHELGSSSDDDRRAQRRADAELAHSRKPFAASLGQHILSERRAQVRDGALETREVREWDAQARRPLLATRIAANELELVVTNAPEDSVVGSERRARLVADDLGHFRRRVGMEARSDEEDPIERRPRLALPLVEARSFERLLGKPGARRRDGFELVVDGIGSVEEELDDAERLAGHSKRYRERRLDHRGQGCGAVGELAVERPPVIRADDPCLSHGRSE